MTRSTFGIGASDIAAIAGQSKYSSPWDVYKRLTQREDLGAQPDVEADEVLADSMLETDDRDIYTRTGWGHLLEPVIRQAYADETGLEVRVPSSLFHRENRWARATPDGIAYARDAGHPATMTAPFNPDHDRLVQCKNVGQFVAREWAEAPPAYVQLQEQWELYVTGLTRADVAALIGGGDFQVFTVWRDDALITDLVTIAEDFWKRVQKGQPPDVDASNACRDHIAGRLAAAQALELASDENTEKLARRYQEHYLAEAAATGGKKLAGNQLLDILAGAGATKLRTALGTLGTRRTPEKTVIETDWKAVASEFAPHVPGIPFNEVIAKHTFSKTTPARIALVAPRTWSALKKGTAE